MDVAGVPMCNHFRACRSRQAMKFHVGREVQRHPAGSAHPAVGPWRPIVQPDSSPQVFNRFLPVNNALNRASDRIQLPLLKIHNRHGMRLVIQGHENTARPAVHDMWMAVMSIQAEEIVIPDRSDDDLQFFVRETIIFRLS